MSLLSEAVNTLKQVLMIRADIERLAKAVDGVSADLGKMADVVSGVRERVARIEGMFEGAALASRKLPAPDADQ
jgi:prophage DNA circulation protein